MNKGQFKKGNYPSNARLPLDKALEIKHAVFSRGKRRLKDLLMDFDVPYSYLQDISCGNILKNR